MTELRRVIGQLSPSIAETLSTDDAAFSYVASTAKFQMRLDGVATLKVDTAATVVSAGVNTLALRYDPVSADVDTAGSYLWRWRVALPSTKLQYTEWEPLEVIDEVPAGHMVSIAQVRAYMQRRASDHDSDSILLDLIGQATAAINTYTGRELCDMGTLTRRVRMEAGQYRLSVAPYTLRAITGATIHPGQSDAAVLTATDYLAPESFGSDVRLASSVTLTGVSSSTFGVAYIDITGSWGLLVTPSDVKLACVKTVAAWFRREVGAVTVAQDEFQSDSGNPWALPYAAVALVEPYRMMVIA